MDNNKLYNILKRAAEGGFAGSLAMIINVLSLMWIRTIINYQYRYGTSTTEAFWALYNDGGLLRFYRGLIPALLQGKYSKDFINNKMYLSF